MGIYSGPEIVKNGLVLHLDAATVKSFRGEPTVNLINNPLNPLSGWSHTNMVVTSSDDGFFSANETTTVGLHIARQSFTTKANTIYTFSCFVKKLGRRYVALSFTWYGNWTGGSGGHTYFDLDTVSIVSSLGSGPLDAGISRIPNTDIFFLYITANSTSVVNSATNLFTYLDENFNNFAGDVNRGVLFKHFQLEEKPYPTPFVDGTRGATVATGGGWGDLSGNQNHGELVNSPTFNGDNLGSLVFDGVDDKIYINNDDSINFSGTQQYTIMSWIYPNFGGVTWHGIVSKGNSQQYALTLNSPNAYLHYETNQGGVGALNSPNGSISQNIWQFVGIRFDGVNKTIWKNGQIIATQSASSLNSSSNTQELRIGEGNNNEAFRGKISQTKIYNRALTAQEIQQNFYATRGRYNV